MALEVRQPDTSVERLASEITRKFHDPLEHERTFAIISARVRLYEHKFQLRSSDVHRAIDAGELTETSEVCRWIMDYNVLVRAGKA